jgi:recombination endonuclease VII
MPLTPEKRRARYAANVEKERKRSRDKMARWRAADPERVNAYQRNWRAANRKRSNQYSVDWRAANPELAKEKDFKDSLKRRYGITPVEYETMLAAQDGCCAICGTNKPGGRGRWHVDHCSKTNIVRRLLCGSCNPGLGFFKHDIKLLQRAIDYLKEYV